MTTVTGEAVRSDLTGAVDTTTEYHDMLRPLFGAYARQDPPKSIAIVGNAPVPASAERAATIDDCDLVVRMTSFALDTDTGEPGLGRRTDVVVLHRGVIASPFTFADYTSRLYLLAEPGRMHWEPEIVPDWWPADLGLNPISNRDCALPLVRLLGLDETQAIWATTGTLVAYLLTEMFPDARVLLTGVSIIDQPVQTRFEHAWGESVEVTAEHRLEAESALLKSWSETGRIELL